MFQKGTEKAVAYRKHRLEKLDLILFRQIV